MRQTLLLALFGTHLALGSVAAQECPAGRERSGDTGIRGVRCVGPAASCSINVASGDGGERRHLFAVEPIVTAVDSASAPLRAGDTLVAIDGVLITTTAGGARLARLRVDQAVVLLVRREGTLLELRLTARAGCGITSLEVVR
jgi:predicted metalloprotease with PDZ domain